jgi:hypothetical protein
MPIHASGNRNTIIDREKEIPMEPQAVLRACGGKQRAKNNLILYFNYLLDKKAHYFSLNESALENLIDQLEDLALVKDASYWLTMARIHELVLLCAENYANNGELTLVGDLLLNPRLILVHVRGHDRPIVKKRHAPLTEQFKSVGESAQDVIQWLKTETFLEIRHEALLPHLQDKLGKSGYFSEDFFKSLNQRKIKITELTGFLASAGLNESLDLYHWLRRAGPSERKIMESKFCPCNPDLFLSLGRQVRNLAQNPFLPVGMENQEFARREGEMVYV